MFREKLPVNLKLWANLPVTSYLLTICLLLFSVGELGEAQSIDSNLVTPNGFRDFSIGMSVEQVKRALMEDPFFDYRGDPDVSFLPQTSQYLIECKGNSYIERAYFQFYNERLYILTLVLNRQKLDHYTMFTTFVKKYGSFNTLSPEKIIWEFEHLRLFLERPLTIKYIDIQVFEKLKEAGKAEEHLRDLAKKDFLEQF